MHDDRIKRLHNARHPIGAIVILEPGADRKSAVGGIGVAGFHVYLEWSGTLECPAGVQGIGSAPQQSLAAFAVLLTLLLQDVRVNRGEGARTVAMGLGLVLGALFTWGALAGSPKPKIPSKPYDDPLNTCRVPYRGSV